METNQHSTQPQSTRAHPRRPYLQVFFGLAGVTIIEVIAAGLALDPALRVVILMGLAIFKAVLVALFYMHLRYDHRVLSVVGGFPFILAVFMLIILMVDRVRLE